MGQSVYHRSVVRVDEGFVLVHILAEDYDLPDGPHPVDPGDVF